MNTQSFLSRSAKQQIRRSESGVKTKDGFVTIHTRLHTEVHALLKQEAKDNNLSIAATLELILVDRYKNRLPMSE